MRMLREALALSALLLGTAGPAAGEAPPAARAEPRLCMNVQPSTAARMLPHVVALGVGCARVSWGGVHPRNWREWIPAYRAAGVEVLPLVYPDAAGDFRGPFRELTAQAGHFPYVQLGNEMDGGLPAGEGARRAGRLWGERIRRVAPLVHATGARIVTPGLAWNGAGVHDYLRGMLEGAGGAIDVVAVHVYGDQVYPTPWGHPLRSRLEGIREAGWRGPVWASEVGVSDQQWRMIAARERHPAPTQEEIDRRQADNLRRVLTKDPARHGYARLYWFQLTPDHEGWSLLRWRSGQPRPAYDWLRRRQP